MQTNNGPRSFFYGAVTLCKMLCNSPLMHKDCLKLEHQPLTGPHKELFSAGKVSWCHVSFTKRLNQLSKEKEEKLNKGIVHFSLGISVVVEDDNEMHSKEKNMILHWKIQRIITFRV